MSILLARQCSLYTCTGSRYIVSCICMQPFCFKTISHFDRPLPIEAAFQHRYFHSTSKFSAENSSPAAAKSSHKAPIASKPVGPPVSSPFKRPPPPLEPHLAFAYTISFEQLQDALNDEQRTKPNFALPNPLAQQVSAATTDPPARNLLVVDVREHNEIEQLGAMPGAVGIPRASAFLFPYYFSLPELTLGKFVKRIKIMRTHHVVSEIEAAFTTMSGAEFERRYGISRPLPGEAGAHNEIVLHCRYSYPY